MCRTPEEGAVLSYKATGLVCFWKKRTWTPFSFHGHLPFPNTEKKQISETLQKGIQKKKILTPSLENSDTFNRKVVSEFRVLISLFK